MDLKSLTDNRNRGEIDFVLFLTIFILAGIGIAMSYSASAVFGLNEFGDSLYFIKKQIVWFCIGFIALLIFQEIDYRIYKRYTKLMLLISLVLLILTLIPGIGKGAKGSVRWLGIGAFRFQPSEFVKVFVVIYLVKVFSSEVDHKVNRILQFLIPMLIVAAIFLLILLQPDFSTAFDLLIVSILILFVSGFSLFYIISHETMVAIHCPSCTKASGSPSFAAWHS